MVKSDGAAAIIRGWDGEEDGKGRTLKYKVVLLRLSTGTPNSGF